MSWAILAAAGSAIAEFFAAAAPAVAEGAAVAAPAVAGGVGAGAGLTAAEGAGLAGGALASEAAPVIASAAPIGEMSLGAGDLAMGSLAPTSSITEATLPATGLSSMDLAPSLANATVPEGIDATGSWLDSLYKTGYGGPSKGGGIMSPLEGITGEAPIGTYGESGWNPVVSLQDAKNAFNVGKEAKSVYDELNKPTQDQLPPLPPPPSKKQLNQQEGPSQSELRRLLGTLPPELRQIYQQLLAGS